MSYQKGIPTNSDCLEYYRKCRDNKIDVIYSTDKPKMIIVIDNKIYTWSHAEMPEGFMGW